MKKTLAVLAVLVALPLSALAQKPVTKTESAEMTATIEAIDHDSRAITLKGSNGAMETVYAGPEVQRFDALKVGDIVTFRYTESYAFEIRKPGQPSKLPAEAEAKVTRHEGAKPGATVTQRKTATVTVKAIDMAIPSITVLTDEGKTASFRVEDKNNLTGVAVGDQVEITYTQDLTISVK